MRKLIYFLFTCAILSWSLVAFSQDLSSGSTARVSLDGTVNTLLLVPAVPKIPVLPVSNTTTSSSTGPWWSSTETLSVIFQYGGLPAVILFFWYMHLRMITKNNADQIKQITENAAEQIKQMQVQVKVIQDQVAEQQGIMIQALNHNTQALSRLGTAMMMGCPLIRQQLLTDSKEGGANPNQGGVNGGDGGQG